MKSPVVIVWQTSTLTGSEALYFA